MFQNYKKETKSAKFATVKSLKLPVSNSSKPINKKIAILLLPENLQNSWDIAKVLFIEKSKEVITLKDEPLELKHVKKHFSYLPDDAQYLVKHFTEEWIEEEIERVNIAFQKLKKDISFEEFSRKAAIKYVYDVLHALRPYFPILKFYTQIAKGKNNFLTKPFTISSEKPKLIFDVVKILKKLHLVTNIALNDQVVGMEAFKRTFFFLVADDIYYLLSYKDFQTLERLKNSRPADTAALKELVIGLEDNEYKLNRNDHFEKKKIDITPTPRILLSELNNAFLMLTPQWSYDGITVDGTFKPFYDTLINGEEITIVRNKTCEEQLINKIIALHPNFINQRNGYYYVSFADAQKKQWFLKAYHYLLDEEIQLLGMDMLSHFRYSPHKIETHHVINSTKGNTVLLDLQVRFGDENVKLAELQKMMLSGQKAVMLKDGSLGILNEDWLHQYGTLIRHGKVIKDGMEISKFMTVTLREESESSQLFKPVFSEKWWDKWRQWQQEDTIVYEVPASVKATLRPYQQRGFEWLTLLSEIGAGGCLADDMGLGKTLQTICFLARFQEENPGCIHLVIAPSSLMYNWQQEFQKFVPHLKTIVHHGTSRNTAEAFSGNYQVVITSYGTLRSDAAKLLPMQYGLAVIDESHNIKNPSAQITAIVQQLNALVRIALSGTPVINNTFDLYSQLSFSLPGMFGSREFFKREYADAIDRDHNQEKIVALQKLTAPFILRRTKEQVAPDLPEKTESILWCNMSREQQDLYNDMQEQIRGSIFKDIKKDGLAKSKLAVIQGIMKLRQICNSPLLLPEAERMNVTKSVKTEVLMQELSNVLKKHKALVFSQFTTMLDILTSECDNAGINYFHFDGKTPPAKRIEMVSAFQQKDSTTNLFLISLKAGNSGINLTAADYVFLFDPYWNRATEQQAIDRTHRIGQTNKVFAYKIICKNTIEEKIIQLQNRKQKIADELISEDDGFIKSLTEEDLLFLFNA